MDKKTIKRIIQFLKEAPEDSASDSILSSRPPSREKIGTSQKDANNIIKLFEKILKGGFYVSNSTASKEEIDAYQTFLKSLGDLSMSGEDVDIVVDGDYGSKTKKQTQLLQALIDGKYEYSDKDVSFDSTGLKLKKPYDGIFGKKTLLMLLASGFSAAKDTGGSSDAFHDHEHGLTNHQIHNKVATFMAKKAIDGSIYPSGVFKTRKQQKKKSKEKKEQQPRSSNKLVSIGVGDQSIDDVIQKQVRYYNGKLRRLTGDQKTFFAKYPKVVVAAAKKTNSKIFPSIVLAQAALETGWGKHRPGGTSNNLFGIKATGSPNEYWDGSSVNSKTKEEYKPGEISNIRSNFRKYNTEEDSVLDHNRLLNTSKRYTSVRSAKDLNSQVDALHASPYATDNEYGPKLKKIISDYELAKYDNFGPAGASSGPPIQTGSPLIGENKKILSAFLKLLKEEAITQKDADEDNKINFSDFEFWGDQKNVTKTTDSIKNKFDKNVYSNDEFLNTNAYKNEESDDHPVKLYEILKDLLSGKLKSISTKRNRKSKEVLYLQLGLAAAMQKNVSVLGKADSDFGGKTTQALKNFQKSVGIKDDGDFGKNSALAMLIFYFSGQDENQSIDFANKNLKQSVNKLNKTKNIAQNKSKIEPTTDPIDKSKIEFLGKFEPNQKSGVGKKHAKIRMGDRKSKNIVYAIDGDGQIYARAGGSGKKFKIISESLLKEVRVGDFDISKRDFLKNVYNDSIKQKISDAGFNSVVFNFDKRKEEILKQEKEQLKGVMGGEIDKNWGSGNKSLDDLDPSAQEKFRPFFDELKSNGFKIRINSSQRMPSYQQRLKRGDRKTGGLAASPCNSDHQYGFAIDMNVTYMRNGKKVTAMKKETGSPKSYWDPIVAIAKKHGIRWQGDSKSDKVPKKQDRVHFYAEIVPRSRKKTCTNFYAKELGNDKSKWNISRMQQMEKDSPAELSKILGIPDYGGESTNAMSENNKIIKEFLKIYKML